MSMKVRLVVSLALGVLITAAFWAASELSYEGANAMVAANLPAVAAGFIVSGNVHQPSKVAVLLTMVVQWTLVSLLALWAWGRIRELGRSGAKQ